METRALFQHTLRLEFGRHCVRRLFKFDDEATV
jgi:hypothetical protein